MASIGGSDVDRATVSPTAIYRVEGFHSHEVLDNVLGHVDAVMTALVTTRKSVQALVARIAIDGIEGELNEIVADERSREEQASLSWCVAALYPT